MKSRRNLNCGFSSPFVLLRFAHLFINFVPSSIFLRHFFPPFYSTSFRLFIHMNLFQFSSVVVFFSLFCFRLLFRQRGIYFFSELHSTHTQTQPSEQMTVSIWNKAFSNLPFCNVCFKSIVLLTLHNA